MDQDNEGAGQQQNEHSIEEIEVYLQQLEKIKKQYSEECNYVEAEKINDKIKQIKKSLADKKKRNLEAQHAQEMELLNNNEVKEMEAYSNAWDDKIKQFEQSSRKSEEEMNIRHKTEMETLAKQLEANVSNNIKYPPEYLHLRRSEMNLSKQQRFKEAEYVKQKRIAIERSESEKFKKQNNDKFKTKLEKLAHKQFLEKQALRKKIEATMNELEKERKAGELKLSQKYVNRRNELEIQQKQEKILSENENLLKKRTTTGKAPQRPQHLLMKTATDGGFSSTNMVAVNQDSSGNKQGSVKNYSPKNVDDFQSENNEKSAKHEEVNEPTEQEQGDPNAEGGNPNLSNQIHEEAQESV